MSLFSLFCGSWHIFDPLPSHGQPPNRSAILVTALQTYFFCQNTWSYWLFFSSSQKIGMFKLSFYFKLRASKAEHGWVEQQHTLARNCLKYFNSQQFFSKRLQKVDKFTWKFTKFQSFNSTQSINYSITLLNIFGYNFWPNHSVIFVRFCLFCLYQKSFYTFLSSV